MRGGVHFSPLPPIFMGMHPSCRSCSRRSASHVLFFPSSLSSGGGGGPYDAHWRASVRSFHSSLVTPSSSSTPNFPPTLPSSSSSRISAALLDELYFPPETIGLENSTGTYTTMDVVDPLYRFDPRAPLFTGSAEEETKQTKKKQQEQKVEEEEEGLLRMMMAAADRLTPSPASTPHTTSSSSSTSSSFPSLPPACATTRLIDAEAPPRPVLDAHRKGKLWSLYHAQKQREAGYEETTTHPTKKQRSAMEEEEEVKENGDATTTSSSSSCCSPPSWFYQLCWDLYHRTDREADLHRATTPSDEAARPLHEEAKRREEDLGGESTSPPTPPPDDPYLFLPFELLDESAYHITPYCFSPTATYSTDLRVRLCLGQLHKEYVSFALAYPFPARHQLPTSFGTAPSRLWVDPVCTTPVVYLQLDPGFPPALWLPLRPTAAAVRRALANFAVEAVRHRDRHQARWALRWKEAVTVMQYQGMLPPPSSLSSSGVMESRGTKGEPGDDENGAADAMEDTTAAVPTTMTTDAQEEANGSILRMIAHQSRYVLYHEAIAICHEHPNVQHFFLGEFDDVEHSILAHFDLCPWLFAIPEMRCVVSPGTQEHAIPTIIGPGVAISLYRCRFSKALLQITVQLSAEVKLPPQDQESFEFLWKDSQVLPKMKIPVFAQVSWPDHTHLSGGGGVLRRWNALFETEFAESMPIDAAWALTEALQWARPHTPPRERHMGVLGMRACVRTLLIATHHVVPFPEDQRAFTHAVHQCTTAKAEAEENEPKTKNTPPETTADGGESTASSSFHTDDTAVGGLAQLSEASQEKHRRTAAVSASSTSSPLPTLSTAPLFPPPRLYPGTAEIPNPEYTLQERLGMYIQYWSHLDDPHEVTATIRALLPTASAPVRMGCAKAALIVGDRALFRHIVSSEPPGRMQVYMTKLVRKRKTRDIVDKVPRLLEDQYEFSAPLWTARHTRMDPNTVEGKADLARLHKGK